MTYQEFVETVTTRINNSVCETLQAAAHTSLKNNNISRIGITISEPEINISPTIYMEEFYHEFQQGLTLDEIVDTILDIYYEIRFDHSWEADTLREFSSVQHQIVYKLIHKKENSALLIDVPYISYHDLAIVFYIILDMEDSGSGTILINNSLLSLWNITIDDLYRAAKVNTPLIQHVSVPVKFRSQFPVTQPIIL